MVEKSVVAMDQYYDVMMELELESMTAQNWAVGSESKMERSLALHWVSKTARELVVVMALH